MLLHQFAMPGPDTMPVSGAARYITYDSFRKNRLVPQGKNITGPVREPVSVLGIETSCDETAAAVVRAVPGGGGEILSSVVLSQTGDHAPYGGVVPEIAARAHISHLDGLVARAMAQAGTGFADLDGVAATAGPGLIGGVLTGLVTAKAIAMAHDLAFMAVNHLEGHALTPGLSDNLAPPYLLLLVSGGHTQLLAVRGVGDYRRYGTTIDDALGEAFDKTAKLLGLGFPGGPQVEKAAQTGDAARFDFPRPMRGRPGCDFSFSGLKTAVRQAAIALDREHPLSAGDKADICAGFQAAAAEAVVDRLARAMGRFGDDFAHIKAPVLVVAGGVAANKALRGALGAACAQNGFKLVAPPLDLCTDNGAMIAWAGLKRLERGLTDGLDVPARARWPLDETAAPAPFAGVKA